MAASIVCSPSGKHKKASSCAWQNLSAQVNSVASKKYFLSGIGGSGMLPLALILKGQGHDVSGSDRGHDQGRTPEKFASLEEKGITLFPQDGSGPRHADFMVVSAAIEETVPDIVSARAGNIPILKRAELLADLFNAFPKRIAVGGTSGKTTVTGMIGFILKQAGLDPVVMCGGVLKNYGTTALVGHGDVFVTESDESDGSIALYNPDVAILTNISIDHKGLDELRALFGDFTSKARVAVINADNAEAGALAKGNALTYGFLDANLSVLEAHFRPDGLNVQITNGTETAMLALELPGAHNLSNALAALAAVSAYGISLKQGCDILKYFKGIKRRMDVVGTQNGITVIDDFAHNPDKIAATLKTLKAFDGRLHVIFQMHGYGPLKLMWRELASTFTDNLGWDDRVYLCDPLYLGGTADKSIGTKQVAEAIGQQAVYLPTREECADAVLKAAKSGDRIIVMGARDDTLSAYADELLRAIRK
ncbi:MAG: UDP-N-acetylmuramate--alanine ligase [Alphaproteobacteria bacterium]|nr:UDP-N-acetylmuramate--alanine ligase [Alphaproteobacteria bacterium]